MKTFAACAGVIAMIGAAAEAPETQPVVEATVQKRHSVFCLPELTARARNNAERFPWAAAMQRELVQRAEPWLQMSDEQLWGLMFGPNITRSWMVWSDGYCPACKKDVRMYAWEIDPLARPWKVRCPNCQELFPKNDFETFHRSGYDEHGIFHPDRADRSLLFNTDHPDPQDPLHSFGVDDGEGYVADGHRWRFIGCYLIYGQWKKAVHAGIVNLASAYAVTGDPRYAYKATVLLDRVADVFPSFDFGRQGRVYETSEGTRGQVSTWHDACEEIRELALAYDRIFEGIQTRGCNPLSPEPPQQAELVAFLSRQAEAYKLENPKRTWADIQRNIEQNIFVDTLNHRSRIESNYPTTDVAMLTIKTVLAWPENREEVMGLLDAIIEKSTAVDGVSGEKGMCGYTAIAPRSLAMLLGRFSSLEPTFLKTVYDRHPVLHQTYRFHIDLWCMDEWYPFSGDSGTFGMKCPVYVGVSFNRSPGMDPSMATFLWNLYELTGDPAFVQVLYKANGSTTENLPFDLFAEDPAAFQAQVQRVINDKGAIIAQGSVNKQNWRLAVLRSGQGQHQRALWLDYDAGERHGHADGMNLGLFGRGLDLMPDFGYPPVGYGGWGAPKARWYTRTAAHNTVVVDGQNQRAGGGRTTLWADGARFHAIRASAPELAGCEQFERTAVLVDLDEEDYYVVDVFYVVGGRDHAKFFHSFFGEVRTAGLNLQPAEPYGHDTEMRNFRTDPAPAPAWFADWRLQDRYEYLPKDKEVHLRYTDLTMNASASLAEAWIETTLYGQGQAAWIPRIMVRRTREEGPLRSVFAAVIEPYEGDPRIRAAKRLPLETLNGTPLPDDYVGLELRRDDGRTDVCLLMDSRGPGEMVEPTYDINYRGQLALVNLGPDGIERLVLCNAEWIRIKDLRIVSTDPIPFAELDFVDGQARLLAGSATGLSITRGDTAIPIAP